MHWCTRIQTHPHTDSPGHTISRWTPRGSCTHNRWHIGGPPSSSCDTSPSRVSPANPAQETHARCQSIWYFHSSHRSSTLPPCLKNPSKNATQLRTYVCRQTSSAYESIRSNTHFANEVLPRAKFCDFVFVLQETFIRPKVLITHSHSAKQIIQFRFDAKALNL